MNFEQAREYSFLVPWKTMECFSGPECWCRIIVPVDPILYNHDKSPDIEREYVIVDAGALDQETAEYIVRLHNEHFDKVKQCCKKEHDKLNIGPRSISAIDMNEMVETFEKLWENKHSKIRKIVRKEID